MAAGLHVCASIHPRPKKKKRKEKGDEKKLSENPKIKVLPPFHQRNSGYIHRLSSNHNADPARLEKKQKSSVPLAHQGSKGGR
jgi:hypothetical protein